MYVIPVNNLRFDLWNSKTLGKNSFVNILPTFRSVLSIDCDSYIDWIKKHSVSLSNVIVNWKLSETVKKVCIKNEKKKNSSQALIYTRKKCQFSVRSKFLLSCLYSHWKKTKTNFIMEWNCIGFYWILIENIFFFKM